MGGFYMKDVIIFEIEGISKKEILKDLGFNIEDEYVIIDNKKIPIEDVEMLVNKDGKLTLLADPSEVSDYFYHINEEDEK
jgi:hypothetical protein